LPAKVAILFDEPWQDCCEKRNAPDKIVKSMAYKLQYASFQAAEQQKQITALQVVFTNHKHGHTKPIAGAKRFRPDGT
jgi:hypothetical protein